TLKDPGDADTGANNLQNFPVLTSAVTAAGVTTIRGTLNSTSPNRYTIDFYSMAAGDPSGFGEGGTYLGSVSVSPDAPGNASFEFTWPSAVPSGQFVSATATDDDNNTSEFSQNVAVTAAPEAGAARGIAVALVNRRVRRQRKLFVRVTFADTGEPKAEFLSPFQKG